MFERLYCVRFTNKTKVVRWLAFWDCESAGKLCFPTKSLAGVKRFCIRYVFGKNIGYSKYPEIWVVLCGPGAGRSRVLKFGFFVYARYYELHILVRKIGDALLINKKRVCTRNWIVEDVAD